MTSSKHEHSDPFQRLETALQEFPGDASQLADARTTLESISLSASEAARGDVSQFATVLSDLVEVIEAEIEDSDHGPQSEVDDLVEFLRKSCGPLQAAFVDENDVSEELREALREAQSRWGDYLTQPACDEIGAMRDDVWDSPAEQPTEDTWATDTPETGESAEPTNNINAILAALTNGGSEADDDTTAKPAPTGKKQKRSKTKETSKPARSELFGATDRSMPSDPPPPVSVKMDPELLEAFTEDASAGLSRLEQLVLAVESTPADEALHQQICREMHTLKGASASVGLPDLAAYLHAVEDYIESSKGKALEVSPMLHSVDAVRAQIAMLVGNTGSTGSPASTSSPTPAPVFDTASPGQEESIRVKASRVDRLMDMLAELVILRNQRDSRLSRLKYLHSELTRCVARIRVFSDNQATALPAEFHVKSNVAQRETQSTGVSGSVAEIASDISEFARSLRDFSEPMEAENIAISQFIRQFRQELMEMRRMPVAGLFQRLNRAARDAARVEGKKIQFLLEGEHAGLDRSLQERLYEPLMHMVRNAVSHGIEAEADRRKAGKPETGTLTLTAKGSPTMLVLEIVDDGRGLDFDAIRRRGLEKGLISVADSANEGRLARLIFHPGFSTRQETSEISGRGVGMDVVAASLQRMRAKIDVESRPGAGTTMRLTIPLRSVIEHAMVVRVNGRLYALPMQYVQAAGPLSEYRDNSTTDEPPAVQLRRLLGEEETQTPEDAQVLVLGSGRLSFSAAASNSNRSDVQTNGTGIKLVVDAVVGPDEVVVRSLPSLLKSHPLLGGVTLSGAGEIVLLLDGQRLLDVTTEETQRLKQQDSNATSKPSGTTDANERNTAIPVLVVDDSLSARRRVCSILKGHGFEITQAGDGREGLDKYRSGSFPLVVTDLEMPRMDGLELLSEIKNSAHGDKTRVVVISSRSEKEYADRAREQGADGYLIKPASDASLTALLCEFGFVTSVETRNS